MHRYIKSIHSLTFSFLFTQPHYLLLFKKFIQHKTLLLSLFLTTNNTEIDREAKPKRCGAEIFRETKICHINSSRTDRLGPGLSRRINTLQIESLFGRREFEKTRAVFFLRGLEKRTEGRKKERKRGKKHRSMPRGIGFFPRFPAKGISDEKLAVLFKYQWANGCNKQHGCFFPAWNLCQEFRRIIKVRPPSPRLFREFAMVSRFPRVWMRLFFLETILSFWMIRFSLSVFSFFFLWLDHDISVFSLTVVHRTTLES